MSATAHPKHARPASLAENFLRLLPLVSAPLNPTSASYFRRLSSSMAALLVSHGSLAAAQPAYPAGQNLVSDSIKESSDKHSCMVYHDQHTLRYYSIGWRKVVGASIPYPQTGRSADRESRPADAERRRQTLHLTAYPPATNGPRSNPIRNSGPSSAMCIWSPRGTNIFPDPGSAKAECRMIVFPASRIASLLSAGLGRSL